MLLNKQIPLKYILRKIRYDLLYVLLVSLTVLVITTMFHGWLPEMPLTIPAFIGTAISILLSFKISQSYDRWWEARKIWGSIVNDSRTLIIQTKNLTAQADKEATRRIGMRQIAWCHSLGQSLRGLDPLAGLDKFISQEDITYISQHTNKSLALLDLQARDIRNLKDNGHLELFAQLQLDSTIVRLCDAQGAAERIKSTVFPVTYRHYLHGIIYLFVVTLAISLENVVALFEVPLLLLISSAFFLLEKSASHMQDPFENRPTDTPVTAIAKTIELNIRQLLNEKDLSAPPPPEGFYLL